MWPLRGAVALLCAVVLAACDGPDGATLREDAPADSASISATYVREFAFVGRREREPLVVVLGFRTVDRGEAREREALGWVAHGDRWEAFLQESWSASAHGSAWAVVPHGPLRVAAGGPAEIEALWFRRGERSLRLELERALTRLDLGAAERVHIFSAELRVGGEASPGIVMELLQLRRNGLGSSGLQDHLLLTSGDTLALYLGGDERGSGVGWMRSGAGSREWSGVRLTPAGSRPLPEARREIPLRWSVEIPDAGIRGELESLAFTTEIGEERAGQRATEARHTVAGWLEIDSRRIPLKGMALHRVD